MRNETTTMEFSRAPLFWGLLALTACSNGNPQLTRAAEFDNSARCATGGVRLETGTDTNTNGVLDDAEVSSSTELCGPRQSGAGPEGPAGPAGDAGTAGPGGPAGARALVVSTALAVGSASCPAGGVRIESGVDDGAGGGTAGNGTLEPGEVTTTRDVCNGGFPYYPGSLTPPAAPGGAYTIEASGGSGTSGNGGNAGLIKLMLSPGSLGGHAKVFRTGVADAGFALPTPPAFVPGAQPLVVNGTLTLNNYTSRAAGIASTDPTFWVQTEGLLFANVAGVATEVTSIDVTTGATLVLPNDDQQCRIKLKRDLRNAGTIRAQLQEDGLGTAHVSLAASNFYGQPGSSIVTAGLAGAGSPGGQGGNLNLSVTGLIINQGAVNTFGGDGTQGGAGGRVSFDAEGGLVVNTGAIDARGGAATIGGGGTGGDINLASQLYGVRNAGALNAAGGNGGTAGGNGGAVALTAASHGSALNSGALTSKGGACNGGNCPGGSAGEVVLAVAGGEVVSSGNIDASGANGTGVGGSGGPITFDANEISDEDSLPVEVGSIRVSGNLNAAGGSGTQGGDGATVEALVHIDGLPRGQEIELFGYTALNANGGSASGGGNGGRGGEVELTNDVSNWRNLVTPGGSAVLYADASARGGDGFTGGRAGAVTVTTQTSSPFNHPNETALSLGATVDLRGGNGSSSNAGRGGLLRVFGAAGATNAAAVNLSGGTVSGSPGPITGGNGGELSLFAASGPVGNSGTVTANGGSSSAVAGGGGEVYLEGTVVTNTAAISCNGANGTSQGGSGGVIWLYSVPNNTSAANTAQLSVTAGSGAAPGRKGDIYVDGSNVTP